MSRDKTPAEIMEEYRAAFEAVNGGTVEIRYARGWYYVKGAGYEAPYRGAQIEDFAGRLRFRARLSERSGQ